MWWKLFKTRKYHIYSKNVVYIHIVYETYLCPFTVGKDLTLGIALFGAISWLKMLILINTNILTMVLDLMHVEVFRYMMVLGLVKT